MTPSRTPNSRATSKAAKDKAKSEKGDDKVAAVSNDFYPVHTAACARDSRPLGHDVCKQCGSGECIQAWQMQQTRSVGRGRCRIRRSHGPLQSCRPVICDSGIVVPRRSAHLAAAACICATSHLKAKSIPSNLRPQEGLAQTISLPGGASSELDIVMKLHKVERHIRNNKLKVLRPPCHCAMLSARHARQSRLCHSGSVHSRRSAGLEHRLSCTTACSC